MKTQNPLIGRSSQKFSNSIFSTWKGINVVRSKPLEVSNPRTPAQTNQRNKFASMVALARLILNTVKLGLKSLAIGKSEYNVFISQNIELQNSDGSGIPAVDATSIVVSKGSLSNINPTNISVGGAAIGLSWTNDNRPFSTPNDLVCIGVFYGDNVTISGYVEVDRTVLATALTYNNNALPIPPGLTAMAVSMFAYNPTSVADSAVVLNNI